MLNLKKTAVAVLALGSSAVFAGTMGPVCAPGNVTVPCERTAWDVGAQALYFQPAYAVQGNYPGVVENLANGAVTYNAINPAWQWGFMVEGSYHFGMGNDINVNWYRIHNTNNYSRTFETNAAASNVVVNPGSASVNPQWDQVDVELGQHVDFGDMKFIRLHGGVEYARVATNVSTQINAIARDESRSSVYNGFGPRGGVDATYELGNGFGVYGKGAGSVLVGTGSTNSSTFLNSVATRSSSYSRTTIVPELEAKLGFTYDYAMAQGDVTLDVGWMWANYFNAQASVSDTPDARGPAGFRQATGAAFNNDWGIQGLYFGAKWVGNV